MDLDHNASIKTNRLLNILSTFAAFFSVKNQATKRSMATHGSIDYINYNIPSIDSYGAFSKLKKVKRKINMSTN